MVGPSTGRIPYSRLAVRTIRTTGAGGFRLPQQINLRLRWQRGMDLRRPTSRQCFPIYQNSRRRILASCPEELGARFLEGREWLSDDIVQPSRPLAVVRRLNNYRLPL